MSERYIVEQANFVLREAVNKYDLGNRGYTDKVELGHLYSALTKEGFVFSGIEKERFVNYVDEVAGYKPDWCEDGAVSDDDVAYLAQQLDIAGFLIED